MPDSSPEFCFNHLDIQSNNILIEKNSVGFIKEDSQSSHKVFFIKAKIDINLSKDKIKKFNISQTGDQYEFKVCDRCFKYLPTSSFSDNRLKKDNVMTKRPSCKECRKINDGKNISSTDRKKWNAKKPSNYELFECPICSKVSVADKTRIVLDHNHKTGKVRGFLCESCNTGIGRFDDDIEILKKAIHWLQSTQ
tara:strand:- start:42 stop:623 length:582 start_codon:yes stop_codon:yes gene_type:complete